MRVAMDLSCLTPEKITGIGVYAENLAKAMHRLCREKNIELEAWIPFRKRRKIQNVTSRTPLSVNTHSEWNRWIRPPALVHGPDFKVPRWGSFKKVVTIHDLVEFENEFAGGAFMEAARRNMRSMLKKCRPDHIICISKFTASRFQHFFPDVDIPVSVVYHGVDHRPGPPPEKKPREGKPYILYVGTLEKRKNPLTLIEAFEWLKSKNFFDLELVLAGGVGLGGETVVKKMKSSFAQGSIRHLPSVSQEKLHSLYQNAEALVLPSLYEGFGLPILEAMRMGTPVITSEFGAMSEISGQAALLVDPRKVEEISEAISTLLSSEKKGLRQDLITRGLQHSAGFTWRKCAEATLDVYLNTL